MARRDIEETEEILDTYEGDPLQFWEKKQRGLLTSVVDYNLSTLAQLVTDNIIDVAPQYQRRFRWDSVRQSRLIESFLMNVPVPPIFLNEDKYGEYSVIDGKQRLMAITEFFRGRLELKGLNIFADVNGMTFDLLPRSLQQALKTRPTLRAIIILRQSDPDVKFEVFQRLNTGGVTLNPQEIRNSTYPGPLNDLIYELSETPDFRRVLGIRNPNRSAIYREMRDAEFVLRFLTFKDMWADFSGGMRRHMDRFMMDYQDAAPDLLEDMREGFLATLDLAAAAFGDCAFKRWVPEGNRWRNQVLASLYDAEMFACFECRSLSVAQLRYAHDDIIAKVKNLFLDEAFRKSIGGATNTPSYFRSRIGEMITLLSDLAAG